MSNPVDLTNLREMTDADVELEKALFHEFLISGDEAIATLSANCTDGANESWRTAAHAFKGTAYNLGAMPLGDLCKQAQEGHTAPLAEKQALLAEITTAYAEVKGFLQKVHG